MNRLSWVRSHIGPIGIDFGARFVRMIQLTRHRGRITVAAYAHRMLPIGTHTLSEYERFCEQAVKEMLAEDGFAGQDVVTSAGWEDVQVRNLRVPSMPEEEVGEVIRFEAAERFGFDPAEGVLQFFVAGDVRQGTEIKQEIVVFGARRATMDARIALLERLGLHPVAIDVGPCAIFRCFERFLHRDEDQHQANAFVDLGYTASRVMMSRGPNLAFVKSIPMGAQRVDELVSEHLDLSLEEAADIRERLYRQFVASMTGRTALASEDEPVSESTRRAVLSALRPVLDQLAKEIGLCLRYCSVTFRGPRADAFTVVGGGGCDLDVLQVLSDQVNMPFRTGCPTRNLAFEEKIDGADRRTGQPEWATALGLALKPVNEEACVGS